MRVIAGKFKGKKLISPPQTNLTRPTLDRVKEAIFSMLTPYIYDSNVLDLFSGSGAIGIEFLSRGAKFVLLNDKEKTAFKTILSNIQLTNCENCVKISMKDYIKCLSKIEDENILFDIIFLDPPYMSNYALNTLEYISNSKDKILSKDGIIVCETDKEVDILKEFTNLECVGTKYYGRVMVKLFKWRRN